MLTGQVQPNPPVLWDIESDPVLAGAEAVCRSVGCGRAVSGRQLHWRLLEEWNGRFRDDVRDFFRGQPGAVRRIADQMVGSPEDVLVTKTAKPNRASTS